MFNFFDKSDSTIQKDVTDEILWDPSVSSSHLTVVAKDGVVTLRGDVPHYFEKSLAESAAWRVGGVRAVADELEVKMVDSLSRSDEEIAQAALNALKWNYSVPQGVRVTVEKGWITLAGEADWDYERNAAKNSVSDLMGVSGVTNEMKIRPKAETDDIQKRIVEALKRSAETEGRDISVKVDGSQVTLSGKVHSYAEAEDARLAAWNAKGVSMVNDHMTISR